MNRFRGLIAVFTLLFLLSGISLLLLVIDDKKDLSSRASIGDMGSGVKPLTSYSQSTLSTNYDPSVWLALETNFYLNQNNNDSLRIFASQLNLASVSAVIGSEFTNPKLLGVENLSVPGWSQEKYSYDFFGETKKVNLWAVLGPIPGNFINPSINFAIGSG